jgi:uncharacterized membrane protein YkvA (DUF1232 family)
MHVNSGRRTEHMNITHVAKYLKSPEVSKWKKALGLLAVLYVVSPVDAIPDVIPFFGWLDDVGVVGAVMAYLMRDMSKFANRPKVQVVDIGPSEKTNS